ncbi:prealbumin-like fold domain-containing protein [Arthrobacter sp. AZCC_0090]|uniref:prealbumin-like fold domain-containing protein n=1 Tax=Arthrobacter sp. AZCC_0090 TaxID=2735881 RepID=UPI00160A7603|nr:prealbumin-like fold domain-containing protein [Arthrobacter sp. AZCC_0090]MBB6405958.1 fimbrial isopeptide formation D2 family protein [Arthrobacter sp. AZCC_0090]
MMTVRNFPRIIKKASEVLPPKAPHARSRLVLGLATVLVLLLQLVAISAAANAAGAVPGSTSQSVPANPRMALPMALTVSQVCTPGVFYAIDSSGGIYRSHVNSSSNPVLDYKMANTNTVRNNANALGVSPRTGILYYVDKFTNGPTGPSSVNIYSYDPTAASPAPVLLKTNVDTSLINDSVVAGAVNPLDGAYYFGGYADIPVAGSNPPQWTVNLYIWRYDPATGAVALVVNGLQVSSSAYLGYNYNLVTGNWDPVPANRNGDFAFDSQGNLYAILSQVDNAQTAYPGSVQIFTITGVDATPGATLANSTGSILVGNSTNDPGYNGIAFDSNGSLIIESNNSGTSTNVTVYDPNTFQPLGTRTALAYGNGTDLASCQPAPPHVKLQKEIVGGRVNASDQFNLSVKRGDTAGNGAVLGTTTTTGSASGLQSRQVGPAAVLAQVSGVYYTFSESQTTATGGYTTTWKCWNTPDLTAAPFKSGTGTSFNVNSTEIPISSGTVSTEVTCRFVNTALLPNLVASKSVDPAAGTMVQPGQVLTYSLTFDNTTGTAPATVSYTDWLGDVLDASTLVANSITTTTTGGTPLVVTNNSGAATKTLGITGTVAAGAKSVVTYQVKVNNAGSLGDASLENYLTPSTTVTPPTSCPAGSTTCTVNPVGVWALSKTASPASGTYINPGDPSANRVITYTVTATNSTVNPITGVILTDDLSQVLNNATFTAGSAKLTINGGTPLAVPDPGAGSKLVTPSFTLPGNGTAVLTYSVTVNTNAWLVTLTNGATGNGIIPPARCVTGGAAPLDPACFTTNPTTGHLFVQKSGPGPTQGSTVPLTGSTFEIRNDAAGQMGATVIGVSSAVSGSPGLVEVRNLLPGTYWLLETKAPNGYSLLATPVKFTVAANGSIALDAATAGTSVTANGATITVLDMAAVKLPAAGGPGNAGLLGGALLGVLLLMTSLALIMIRRADKTPQTQIAERSSVHLPGDYKKGKR